MTEYHAYWDWPSYFLYLLIGIVVLLLVNFAEQQARQENGKKIYPKKSWYAYGGAFVLLVFIASTRLVSKSVGGTDAWNYYVGNFIHPKELNITLLDIITLNKGEPLYFLLVKLIRSFTDNYHIFFTVIYSIISYSFLRFLSKNYSKKGLFIPCLMFMILYLYSFSAIRWYLCLSFALLAMCAMQENKIPKAFLMAIIAFLFHYTGLIIIAYLMYVIFMKNYVEKKLKNDKQYIVFLSLSFLIVLVMIPFMRMMLVNTKYDAYLSKGFSIWGYLPIFLLITLVFIFFKQIRERDKGKLNFYGVCFNFIITPIVMFCGAYRFDYFFLLSRMFIWGYIARLSIDYVYSKIIAFPTGVSMIKNEIIAKRIMYMLIVGAVLLWFSFRLYQMHISNSLMPYINIFWR